MDGCPRQNPAYRRATGRASARGPVLRARPGRTLGRRMGPRVRSLFESFVAHSGDRRLDRLAGSRRAQGIVFDRLARRFDPRGARGFTGELQFDLRRIDGRVNAWTIVVDDERAIARSGPADGAGRDDLLRRRRRRADGGGRVRTGERTARRSARPHRRLGRRDAAGEDVPHRPTERRGRRGAALRPSARTPAAGAARGAPTARSAARRRSSLGRRGRPARSLRRAR